MKTDSTICAVATPSGGALGVIRISGPEAIDIANEIFCPIGNRTLELRYRKSHTLAYGTIVDETGEMLDEVLASIFLAPNSYTGEDSVELSCHGSAYILQQIMQLLVQRGCRLAEPGEFTQRAFLNGKLDLVQAEAVADLIAANSSAMHHQALRQLRGEFSNRLTDLRRELLHLTSLMELELDFSDHEDLEFADRSEIKSLCTNIETAVSNLLNSYRTGNAIRNGIMVPIVGEANAGKSTLLNCLLEEGRAIVSDIPGTTRDTVEEARTIGGMLFRFIDTAGLRETTDPIENQGIERSYQKIRDSELLIWVVDASESLEHNKKMYVGMKSRLEGKKVLVLLNKSDLIDDTKRGQLEGLFGNKSDNPGIQSAFVSAKFKNPKVQIEQFLIQSVPRNLYSSDDLILLNVRHYESLKNVKHFICQVRQGLDEKLPNDLIVQDLRECVDALAQITGERITTENVLESIFKNFCVGK